MTCGLLTLTKLGIVEICSFSCGTAKIIELSSIEDLTFIANLRLSSSKILVARSVCLPLIIWSAILVVGLTRIVVVSWLKWLTNSCIIIKSSVVTKLILASLIIISSHSIFWMETSSSVLNMTLIIKHPFMLIIPLQLLLVFFITYFLFNLILLKRSWLLNNFQLFNFNSQIMV